MKIRTLKIGDLKLKNPLFLAPMVDVTDLPYRLICRKAGASMAYTEMIYVDAILHENTKTKNMMLTNIKDKPLGIQITGNDVKEFRKVIPHLKKNDYNLVDINCGCPSSRIVGNQAGSFLLQNPDKIANIIKILKNEDLNVTAKIRLGFNKNNSLEIAKKIEKAGAEALTVHGRLASEGNDTPADWKKIKKVKENIGIPVIGNGDVNSGEKASQLLNMVDGIMIARAAIGDPLIFKRVLHYLKTGKEQQINIKDNLKSFNNYLSLANKYNLVDLPRIKYLSTKFLRGFPNASSLRDKIMKTKEEKEIINLIKEAQNS